MNTKLTWWPRQTLAWILMAPTFVSFSSARAIILFSTADPATNTAAPAGLIADSGWQFQGQWGSFLGTAIAPKHFITAKHVGGAIGDAFTFDGISYLTSAWFDDAETDLRIWRVCGTLPRFASLYTGTNELGKNLVAFGRGTQRGLEVTIISTNQLGEVSVRTNGWQWGPYDGVQRWGENVVAEIVNGNGVFGSSIGELLQADFNTMGEANECHLSSGDSGGALFLQDGPTWKLAAIHYAVDGPYSHTNDGEGFSAAIFDERGLYRGGDGQWQLIPDLPVERAGSFYSTRISVRAAWIESVLNAPVPADTRPILQTASAIDGPFADAVESVVDESARTITVPLPSATEFYRLRSCPPYRIVSITLRGADVALAYE